MAKKSLTKKSVKIYPEVSTKDEFVEVGSLNIGEFFLYDNQLWMLTVSDPYAVSLSNNKEQEFLYEIKVIPVNVEIKWTKRK